MHKETAMKSEKSAKIHRAAPKDITESVLPTGSWQRVTVGVAAAAGSGLLAVALIGVGPAAIAGAAGYLAYRGLRGERVDHAAARDGHTKH